MIVTRLMLIHSADFVLGAVSPQQFPADGKPHIAFAGRSNVGKSSLINCLLQRRSLARTSNTPGRTQQINFFLVNAAFWFADLPGFGYAKVSKEERERWRRLIETYLRTSEDLRAVVFLMDARHGPQANDLQLLEYLLAFEVPFIPVLTKADKVNKTERVKCLKALETEAPVLAAVNPVLFSAVTRSGRDEVLERVEGFVT